MVGSEETDVTMNSMTRYLAVLSLLIGCLFARVALGQQSTTTRVVDIRASDGSVLKATYFAAANTGPGVLLLHQCNRQRKLWDDLAQQLSAAGINVLTFDLRGFGESSGTAFDKLSQQESADIQANKWPGDIDAAFDYLVSQPGVQANTIGLGGASCGVNNSVKTALRHPKQVKSLVLLSGSTDMTGRTFLRQQSQLPVFFSAADDDEFQGTVELLLWLYGVSSNPGKKFVRFANGGHGADMFATHPELRRMIVDWYVTTLIKTPGHAPASKDSIVLPRASQVFKLLEEPGGIDKIAAMLAEARRNEPKAVLFPESIVNIIGYEHLQARDSAKAVQILKLNVTAFPASANAYDSLSDAYLANGQKELARQNARKALELLVSDSADTEARRNAIRDSAQQKLKQLGDGAQ